MTDLSGTLQGVGLPAIIRFLSGLKKTGTLRIANADWQGEIAFDAGQVTDASLGSRRGLSALEGLVQTLAGGSFTFDTSAAPARAASIDLAPEALQKHLEELVASIAGGAPHLPSVDSVPALIAQDELAEGEEPLPLDRGTLQTLLAVDGRRSVREIVAHRGSFDALWQLASLADVGLVRLTSSVPENATAPDATAPHATTPDAAGATASGAAPVPRPVTVEPVNVRPELAARPSAAEGEPDLATPRCPKLGFEDDPGNSFGRPTRLHRCFAADAPLTLSLDQQRELCLSDQFGTCPRLTAVGGVGTPPPIRDARTAPPRPPARPKSGNTAPAIAPADRSEGVPSEAEVDHSRIVRLPFSERNRESAGGAGGERPTASQSEPTRLRASAFGMRNTEPPQPTPLRARIDRANNAALTRGMAESATTPPPEQVGPAERAPERAPGQQVSKRASIRTLLDDSADLHIRGVPVRLIVGGATVLIVVAVLGFVLVPLLGNVFQDDSTDLSGLPNASAVAAGTPVALIAPRPTRVVVAPNAGTNVGAAVATDVPAPTVVPEAAVQPSVQPVAPAAVQADAQPSPQPSAQPAASGPSPAAAPASAIVLDERFANNARSWPSDPQGTAWLNGGSYRLSPRQAGQFVAVGAPMVDVLRDVVVNATFHKLSGAPDGGGFGIIVRDQGSVPLDGVSQGGKYYVLEVGDKGEVGIWRRDGNQWIDLVPWQHSDAVKTGTATNDLVVSAVGNRLTLAVNGTQVVTQTDSTLTTGRVGLLAGGDGNQIAVDHFTVQTP